MLLIDKLTRLYNRKGFARACRHMFENLDGQSSSAMLLSVNLAHLKFIEHALGPAVAEEMLKRTADILLEVFQDDALIGRWNAGHFVLLSVAAPERCNSLVRSLQERVNAANASESRISLNLSGHVKLIDLIAHEVRLDRSDEVVH
jgi:diguanylate cyclase (GGDEF)-like protein